MGLLDCYALLLQHISTADACYVTVSTKEGILTSFLEMYSILMQVQQSGSITTSEICFIEANSCLVKLFSI